MAIAILASHENEYNFKVFSLIKVSLDVLIRVDKKVIERKALIGILVLAYRGAKFILYLHDFLFYTFFLPVLRMVACTI